jgi:stage III sporulation protein AE
LILASAKGERGNFLSFCLLLLGSVAIYFLASGCHADFKKQTEASVGCLIALAIFPTVLSALSSVESSILALSDFFAALTPITVGITALGGGSATASVQAVGMYTALSSVGGIGGEIFISLSAFGLSMSLLSAFGNEGVGSVTRGFRSLFGWVTGIFTALLTAAFSLQTIVASSVDRGAMRAIKYAASGLIPVVGSTVSGAISTLASGLSYAKGIIGGGAILVMLYMAISPLAVLLIYRLALTLAGIFADFAASSVASRIFSSYRFALDMTVTVYSLSVLIYLFEIVIFILIGVAAS